MTELAADSILAETFTIHVGFAEGHAVFAGDVCLLDEFVIAVSKGTIVSKFAVLALEPEFANFCLFLLFVCRLEILLFIIFESWECRGHECRLEFSEGGLELGGSRFQGHWSKEALSFSYAKFRFIRCGFDLRLSEEGYRTL